MPPTILKNVLKNLSVQINGFSTHPSSTRCARVHDGILASRAGPLNHYCQNTNVILLEVIRKFHRQEY
jgi:hypothetical protein